MEKVKLFGLGGQGVVTGAKMLTYAVVKDGKYAQNLPAYGHERRGAPVSSDVMIDDKDILLKTYIYEPDVVVVFDLSVIEKGMDIYSGVSEDTVFIINCEKKPEGHEFVGNYGDVYYVDSRQISLDTLGRNIPNSAMVGAMAKAGLVTIESVEQTLSNWFKGKGGEINAEAARRAYEECRKL